MLLCCNYLFILVNANSYEIQNDGKIKVTELKISFKIILLKLLIIYRNTGLTRLLIEY